MVKSTYHEKQNLLQVELTGSITGEALINYIKSFNAFQKNTSDLRVIQDCREAILDINMVAVEQAGLVIAAHLKVFKTIKVASVFSDSKSTAYSMLIESKADFQGYTHKVFSSIDSAKQWMG